VTQEKGPETDKLITRRQWLTRQAIVNGSNGTTSAVEAVEAVSSAAGAHPEWDMEEKKTWAEWEQATK